MPWHHRTSCWNAWDMRAGQYGARSSLMSEGDRSWRPLKVKRTVLNVMHLAMGSQCNCINRGVMWSNFEDVTNRTVAFWTDWSFCRYVMHMAMGSQCNCINRGVMWSNFEDVTNRTAAFWTDWSFCRYLGMPYSRELQKSNFNETKAWTRNSVVLWDKYFLMRAMFRSW